MHKIALQYGTEKREYPDILSESMLESISTFQWFLYHMFIKKIKSNVDKNNIHDEYDNCDDYINL